MGRTICLDLDGVLHQYTSPWTDEETISDPPTPGAQTFCANLIARGFDVVVNSSRCRTPEGTAAVRCWLDRFGFPSEVAVAGRKPSALVYVDDRGLRFEGDFASTLEMIGTPDTAPLPWNKKTPEEPKSRPTFENELSRLINHHSMESGSDTPDFILANYLKGCLDTFNAATREREKWYGRPAQAEERVVLSEPTP